MKRFYIFVFFICFSNIVNIASSKEVNNFENTLNPSGNITSVNELDPAAISATITGPVSVCLNSTNQSITLTGTGGTAPYTFKYKINNILTTSKTSNTSSSFTVPIDTSTPNTYNFILDSVSDATNKVLQSGSLTVVVNALPIADFTSDNNVCSGTEVAFTNNSTGSGTMTYLWDFGESQTSNLKNPTHVYTTIGNVTKSYNVTLIVTDNNSCQSTVIRTVNIKQSPDATLNGTGSGSLFDGIPAFKTCSNSDQAFTFTNASTTTNNISYKINWGDGTSDFESATFNSTNHFYTSGLWNLTYTIVNSNGCTTIKPYIVFVGSNPAVSLGNPGNTDICISDSLTFPITGTINNPTGTIYTITFNDGSSPQVFSHPAPNQITHKFLKSSGGTTSSDGSTDYTNSFYAKIVASNPCGTSAVSVVPIYVSSPPIADFTISTNSLCLNVQNCFVNTTTGANEINGSTNTSIPKIIWSITPDSGYTLKSGSLGNDFNSTEPNLWISGSNQICPVFTQPGTYTIGLKSGNHCSITQKTRTVCVENSPVPIFTLDKTEGCFPLIVNTTNTTNEATVCTAPSITYTWEVTYSVSNCGNGSGYSISNGTSATKNPIFQFTKPGTYKISLSAKNTCNTITSDIQTVIVKSPPTVIINPVSDLCQTFPTTSITPISTVKNCGSGTLSYEWSFPDGLPDHSTAADPGTVVYSNSGSHSITLKVTNECSSVITNTSFIIKPRPIITNSSLSQTICSGFATGPITFTSNTTGAIFSWNATATPGITGYTPSGTNTIPAQTISTSNSVSGAITYSITPILNGCEGDVVNYIVHINPSPEIVNQPQSSTVCQDGNPTILSISYNKGTGTPTYQWYSNIIDSNSGGTFITDATNSSIIPSSANIGTKYYYCIITFPLSNCTNLTSKTASVTINALPRITDQPKNTQTICVGGSIAALSVNYTGGVGTSTYQWFSNTTSSNTEGTRIPGATSSTFTPSVFNIAGNNYYYCEVILSGNRCGSAVSNPAEVIVVAAPTVNAPLATQTLCESTAATVLTVNVVNGTGTYLYQWYSNTINFNSGGTSISSATSSTYTPPTTGAGTTYYYCMVSQTGLGCSVASQVSIVIVVPAPTIDIQPLPGSACKNGILTPLSVSYKNGTGTASYKWFSNTIDNTETGTGILGATLPTYNPPSDVVEEKYYYCEITFSAGGCTKAISKAAKITINALPTINLQPIDSQSICLGGTILPLTVTYKDGVGSAFYQWYKNTGNASTGGLKITGATNSSYIPTAFNAVGDYYYYVEITLSGNGCTSVLSNTSHVRVVADPTVSAPLATQTLCESTAATVLSVNAVNGTGTYLYQWYSNTINSNSGGTSISSATSSTYTPPTADAGTTYYYCLVSQTGLGCSVASQVSTVIVVPAPSIDIQPLPGSVCKNGILTPLSVSYKNGTGTASYKWFSNTIDNTETGLEISGVTLPTYNPPSDVVEEKYYYCEITFSAGGCIKATSKAAKITINALPTINLQPLDSQSICLGGTILPLTVTYKDGVGSAFYQWYKNTGNTSTGGLKITGATNSSYIPPVFNAVGDYYYYVEITLSGNGCSSVLSNTSHVKVVADPTVSAPLATQTQCESTAATVLSVNAVNGTGTYLYQWYSNTINSNSGGTSISSATSSTYTPPTAGAGTTYYYCLVSQTGLGCSVASQVSTVIVVPAPLITTHPNSETVCLKEIPAQLKVAYINGTGAVSYQWFSNTVDDSASGIEIYGATGATLNPPYSEVGIKYYYCVITFSEGGCRSLISNLAKVTINQYPVISTFTKLIGSGTNFIVTPLTTLTDTVPSGTTYTWTVPVIEPVNSVTGTSAQANAQTSINQTIVNVTKVASKVTYTVTPTSDNCVGVDFKIIVTVNPPISPNETVKNISCFGLNNGSIATNIQGGIPPYTILWTGPNAFSSNQSTISGLFKGDYELKITDHSGLPFTMIYKISEPDEINIKTITNKNISCFGAKNGEIALLVTGGTKSYIYSWEKDSTPFNGSESLTNLGPGNYSVSITDANNCGPKTASFSITEPTEIAIRLISLINLKCYGDTIGALTVNIEGGVPFEKAPGVFDYTYSWSGPNGFTSNEKDLVNLAAGNYTLTVTDSTGCNQNFNATITQPAEIKIDAITSPVTCYGENDASIKLDIQGGIPPYQIQWSNYGKGLLQENLSPGTYTITVTDFNNCSTFKEVIITEAEFSIQPIIKNITCFGAQNGSIQLNIKGGIPPVTLSWADNKAAGSTRNGLKAGTYEATLSDGSSCTFTRSYIIIEPTELKISGRITNAFDCNNQNSGSIDLSITGGTQPYTISWSNGDTTAHLSAIPAGYYVVEVTDANGCTYNGKFEVIRPAPIQLSVKSVSDFDCQSKVLKIISTAQITGGVPPYQFTWSGGISKGLNNEIMETSQSGIYILGVVDGKGCISDYTFHLDVPDPGIDYQIINCDAHSFAFNSILPTGIASDYTFGWDFGDGKSDTIQNPQHTFPKPATYRVNLTLKSTTCTSVFEKIITVESPPILVLDKLPVFCTGDSLLLHVTGAESYRWNNGTTGDSLLIKQTGDYSVLGTSKAGCTATLLFKATNFDTYNFTIQSDKNEVTTADPTIRLWSESITYSEYFWDFGDAQYAVGNNQTHTFTNLKDGYYDVKLKVKNPNGCIEFATSRIWRTNTSTGNVFTPNGDGIDDVFLNGWHIQIYNRNGILIYEGIDGWDGTFKGKPASNDTYFYVLYISGPKEINKRTGFVTVIR